MAAANRLLGVAAMERWQARVLRWMTGLSLLFHAGVLLLGSTVSALFPPISAPPVVFVEIADPPLSALPEEAPAPPPPPVVRETALSTSRHPLPSRPPAVRPSRAEEWLKKLDAGLARVPEAPVTAKAGKPGIPVRRWETDAAPRPGDFAPAVAPENKALLGEISELEGKVRAAGVPGVGVADGEEVEVLAMFGGTGAAGGDPIPPWIREMIRNKVRERLPELEILYSAAFRRDPAIRGKLLVRFRIDPSGRVVLAEPRGSSLRGDAFIESVLTKVRGWTFDPPGGRTVEVLYPFVFVAPS
jgi:hypothetical protein